MHDSSSTIRLVCFDLGGVVIRICRSWQEGCTRAGIDLREIASNVDLDNRDWLALIEQHQTGCIHGNDYFRQMSALLAGAYTPDEVERIHLAWTVEPYEGVLALISELHSHQITTAALSNTNHEHWLTITQHPELRAMDHLVASHIIGMHKPDRRAYEHVEQLTGSQGSEIIFFDDSPENVDAARAMGWHASLIDHTGNTAMQMRSTLDELGIKLSVPETLLQ